MQELQNVKGTYDYFGKTQAVRQKVQAVLRGQFELYDFESMDTTLLNELDLLTSKYAGGDEIVKEMYQLTDQGGRRLGLRYDLTIPFSKVIALNPGMELPYRRYEIGKVFRDGPVKKGRLREFLQCDADIVGVSGPQAEAELMMLAADVFRRLDIPVVIQWNNRRFLGEVLQSAGIAPQEHLSVMLTLDKLAKIGRAGVLAELESKHFTPEAVNVISNLLELKEPGFPELAERFSLSGQPGAEEVLALQQLLADIGLAETCRFDPFLSRGLSFYTGTVYEIFDASGSYTSSLGSGGRYDAIVGKLLGREDMEYPTAGISFGMESIMALLGERQNSEPKDGRVLIVPIGANLPQALLAASALRSEGIRVSVDSSGRKLKKTLASASAKGTRFVILIGDSEAESGNVRLKDMLLQTEEVVPLEEALLVIGKWTHGPAEIPQIGPVPWPVPSA
ncbi:histidine--tRNA ligase [Paenibacillus sp. PK3_47]|uniref:histidine--tRNA ligase n=1 Tax=Paenibacillus sp. PK3_47 TaxID=2072642 RepID=UPI00201DC007|nr:histidine--tRNA ligase [Paenibacillus sp. PK3_47]UQZ37639.1 histidine--tRNA ligase [Paenibacillus sp. PK3_47]